MDGSAPLNPSASDIAREDLVTCETQWRGNDDDWEVSSSHDDGAAGQTNPIRDQTPSRIGSVSVTFIGLCRFGNIGRDPVTSRM